MATTSPGEDLDSVILPAFLAGLGYRIEVATVKGGQFYWHAWRDGNRVNGGLEENEGDAARVAQRACSLDVTHRNLIRGVPGEVP